VYDYPRRPSWSWEEEARQHAQRKKKIARRNRISMLAALLVLAGGLIYVSWRNSQSWPGNSHSLPHAVQPSRPATAQPSQPAASAKSVPAVKESRTWREESLKPPPRP